MELRETTGGLRLVVGAIGNVDNRDDSDHFPFFFFLFHCLPFKTLHCKESTAR